KIGQALAERATAAEAAYNRGYDLLEQFRFQEAIPLLEEALRNVPLADFYFALGTAYAELPDLARAATVLREGLGRAEQDSHPDQIALVSGQLGRVLLVQGDLVSAVRYTQRALAIDERIHGPDHPDVARDANDLARILQVQGELS